MTRFDRGAVTVEEAIQQINADKKRSPVVALGVIGLTLFAALITVYLSYRDVPAARNPANARPNLVEPYR